MKTKRCSKCKKRKSVDKFGKDKLRKDKLFAWCRICVSKHNHEYQQTNRGKQASKKTSATYRKTLEGCIRNYFTRMRYRCNSPKANNYLRYGGRGIKCLFTSDEFFTYVTIDLGYDTCKKLRGLEIHRINPGGHYESGNIEFLTPAEHRVKHVELRRLQKQVA